MALKRKEWMILAGIAVLAVAAGVLLLLQPHGAVAVVSVDGVETARLPLSRDGVHHIDARLPVTLVVEDGTVRFDASECPDKLCEGFGRIGNAHEYAICMPAGVVVMVEEE